MHQEAVVNNQKRLARCLRDLEIASQHHKNVAKSLNISFHALAVGTAVAIDVNSSP